MKKALIFIVLLANLAGLGTAAKKFDPELATRLQKALDGSISAGAIGLSAAVVLPDGTLWAGTAGVSHQGVPVTTTMLFNVASIQKNFQATLALLMVEQGLLSLDDTLDKWLPAMARIDGKITVRQLLGLTSGVADFVKGGKSPWQIGFAAIDFAKNWTWEEIHSQLVGEPEFKPGERCSYSTTNFILLRLIMEKAARSSLKNELNRRILKPLRLRHTLVVTPASPPPAGATVHGWYDHDGDGKPIELADRPLTWIASLSPMLVFSTPSDLARWMNALFHEKRILKEETLKQMLVFRGPVDNEPLLKGYGLGVEDLEPGMFNPGLAGMRLHGHLGNEIGTMSCAGYFPDHGISLALASNRGGDSDAQAVIVIAFNALMDALAARLSEKP